MAIFRLLFFLFVIRNATGTARNDAIWLAFNERILDHDNEEPGSYSNKSRKNRK